MLKVIDQMGRKVSVSRAPQRIVSLVPSQTELLVDLGLIERLVGVTDFCTEPAAALASKPRIGGTKRFAFDRIAALEPDLIIGNREENYQEGIARLATEYPVWMSDIASLEQNCAMIRAIGAMTGTAIAADRIAAGTERAFANLGEMQLGSAAYLIWRKPWMAAASGTFIDAMMRYAGFENAFQDCHRYPEIGIDELVLRAPEWVLLSSEPFPFTQTHVAELAAQLPGSRVVIVDAMPFSWYGSRMLNAADYFCRLRKQLNEPANALSDVG